MTTAIKLKKSSVIGKKPLTGDLDYGELAINYADGKLFYKNSSNEIRSFLDSAQIQILIDSDYITSRVGPVGSSQNVFSTIAVAGQANVVADSTGDTLTLVAGSNIVLTTNATNDSITISSTASGGGGGISATEDYITLDTFVGDSATTDLTLSTIPSAEENVFITINGVSQHTSAYTINNNVVSLSEAPLAGDDIEVRTLSVYTTGVQLRDYQEYVYQPSVATNTFQDSDINGNVLLYDIGKVEVFLNGTRLTNGLDFNAVNGSSITLLGGTADSGDTITISSYGKAYLIDRGVIPAAADTPVAATQYVADQYDSLLYRTTKYIIQLEHDSDNKYHAAEVLLTHNGTTVFMTEYGEVLTDSSLGTFDADILGGQVRLLVTPAYNNTSIKTQRITVGA